MGKRTEAEEKSLSRVTKEELIKFHETHKAWEKLPNEPHTAYKNFCLFREMLPEERGILPMSKMLNKAAPHLYQLSMKHNWFARAAEWDQYVDRKKQAAYIKTIEEATKRHVQHAMAIETGIMLPVQKLLEKAKADPNYLSGLTAKELLDAVFTTADKFPKIVDVERKSRGMATDVSKVSLDTTTDGKALQPNMTIVINGSQSLLLQQQAKETE